MDLQKIPPIQQKRIVTFVNYFIIDTVSFLNTFINASENTLWKLEKRMRKLETTLKLLEVKLNFIPESGERVSSSNVALTTQSENNINNSVNESEENNVKENSEEEIINNEEKEETAEPPEEIPEEIQKYLRMIKVGVPIEAVKLKMRNENVDPGLLKLD